jgi:hypothetical protein
MLGMIAAVGAGCGERTSPTEYTLPLFAKGGNHATNFGTHLNGDEEVLVVAPGAPHPSESNAQGQAHFTVNDDGTVDFKLMASNIDNVVQSHIHCGRFGQNGPIRMWLFPVIGPSGAALTGPTGAQNGVLAQGTFNPAGIICPAANVGSDMPLLDAIRAGLAYVNVHTNDGVLPPNTGPGDFPGGELRGQLGDKNNP